MSTITTNLGLIKAEGSDIVNVVTHIANNFQAVDNTFAANTPSTQAIGDAASQGSAVVVSRSDHKHAMPAFGTPVATGTAISNGVSANIARADHVHTLNFGAVVALDGTTADGTGQAAARNDHKHAMAFGAISALDGAANSNGAATTGSRSDHKHAIALASQANGDLFYATGANTFTRLAIGSGNAYLTISGGVPAWGASGQIIFPAAQNASANANTLDDYEEGTFTPTLGGTATYTDRSGNYTKVGNWVHIQIRVNVATIGTGNLKQIDGLPFTPALENALHVGYWSGLATACVSQQAYTGSSVTSVFCYGLAAAATGVGAGVNLFANGALYYVAGTYKV